MCYLYYSTQFSQFKVFCLSPLSCSQSGDEAPLHSLRGPSTGDPEPGSWSRSGQTERDGGDEEEESRGYEVRGQGRSRGADVELVLQVDWVSGSSSDGEPLQLSSKFTDITERQTQNAFTIPAEDRSSRITFVSIEL